MRAGLIAVVGITSLLAIPAGAATLVTDNNGEVAASAPVAAPPGQVEFIEGQAGTVGIDRSGKGAVLCMWQVLVTAQMTREPCGLSRQQIDDAIDIGVAKIDAFIIKYAKRSPTTAESLAAHKASLVQGQLDALSKDPEARADICMAANGFHAMPAWPAEARILAAKAMRNKVNDLLSVPREPVMNPCF